MAIPSSLDRRSTGPARATDRGAGRSLDDLCPSRRTLLHGLAALGGAVLVPGVLVACGSSDETTTDSGADGSSSSGGSTVAAADVAVGTAVVVSAGGENVVVAQPTEGSFVAFSAKCTHQGTTVESSDSLVVTCPNHGSQFDLADGAAVLQGPATTPLTEIAVTVDGDNLVLG